MLSTVFNKDIFISTCNVYGYVWLTVESIRRVQTSAQAVLFCQINTGKQAVWRPKNLVYCSLRP